MLNARAWLMWIAASLTVAMLATNPLYLVIVLLCAALVRAGFGTGDSPLPVWRFGLTVVAFSTFYNALLTHFGSTVLVTLPRALPLVGGPVTLEAAAFGASRGLALWTLFAVSTLLNDVISPYELVRLTPRFLRQAGLVVSIMLAFVPQTVRSFHQVREAQAIRGHRLRGVRDLTALLVPLMTDSLEKAVQLAEAMEARGYGKTQISKTQSPASDFRTSGVDGRRIERRVGRLAGRGVLAQRDRLGRHRRERRRARSGSAHGLVARVPDDALPAASVVGARYTARRVQRRAAGGRRRRRAARSTSAGVLSLSARDASAVRRAAGVMPGALGRSGVDASEASSVER